MYALYEIFCYNKSTMRVSHLIIIILLLGIFGAGIYRITHPQLKRVTITEEIVVENKDDEIPPEIDAIIQRKEDIEPIAIPDSEEKPIALEDDDGDGLNLFEEAYFITNDLNPDTDSDGFSDLIEIQGGFNPKGKGKLVATSVGVQELYGTYTNTSKNIITHIVIKKDGTGTFQKNEEQPKIFSWRYKNNVFTIEDGDDLAISSKYVLVKKENGKVILDVNQLGSHVLFPKK